MLAFLDFEASSLGRHSVPIEVAWVIEDGRSQDYLIRPAQAWADWAASAEAIHGISRESLVRDGTPHNAVAAAMVEALAGHALLASAPSWHGKWLSVRLRAGGFARDTLRLRDSEEAHATAARDILSDRVSPGELDAMIAAVLAEAEPRGAGVALAHRALADAEGERQRWLAVWRIVSARVAADG